MLIAAVLSTAMLLLGAAGSRAQVRSGAWEVSPAFGMFWTDVNQMGQDLDARSELLGINAARHLTNRFSAEGSFHWGPTTNQNEAAPRQLSLAMVDGGLLFHLTSARFVPYGRGGVGLIHEFTGESAAAADGIDEVYFTFGGGFKVYASESGGFRFDIRDMIYSTDLGTGSDETLHNLAGTAAAVFQFGGIPPVDSDGDGIFDKKDDCPDTPFGAVVDERGCPSDADGDGVFDGLDQCADTPAGARVDRKGCPIDSDGDGVFDGLDECPDTPAGARVDRKGCPIDSDADGVFDGLDKCPDTPAGSKVDRKGCKLTETEYMFLDTGTLRLSGVRFSLGSADIDPDSYPTIDEAGRILEKWNQLEVEIGGYTDSQGSESFNRALSEKRAASVRDYLLKKFPGIHADNLTSVGYGEANPVADNATREGREQNRRVEFKVLNRNVLQQIIR
jgi:OOP family OmpA-OmpF porin